MKYKYGICFKKEVITEMYIESFKRRLAKDGFVLDEENPEYVFFLGGDGTFLRAVHKYIDKVDKIKFVGLNAGTLGFYLDYSTSEIDLLINDIKSKNVNIVSYPLIKGKIVSKKETQTIYAVNEIRIEVQKKLPDSERKYFKHSRKLLLTRRQNITTEDKIDELKNMLNNYSENLRVAYREKECLLDIIRSEESSEIR